MSLVNFHFCYKSSLKGEIKYIFYSVLIDHSVSNLKLFYKNCMKHGHFTEKNIFLLILIESKIISKY